MPEAPSPTPSDSTSSQPAPPAPTVLFLAADLIWATRIKATAEDLGVAARPVRTMEMLEAVDVVVTMGCGDACPFLPGKKYVDWPLNDPAGQGVDAVRPIRDEIQKLVEDLIAQIA